MDLITWTTPIINVMCEGFDLSDYQCSITVEQLTRSGSVRGLVTVDAEADFDGTDSYVHAALSQEQTGRFAAGAANVTVNAINGNGKRVATEPIAIVIGRNPVMEVLTYE